MHGAHPMRSVRMNIVMAMVIEFCTPWAHHNNTVFSSTHTVLISSGLGTQRRRWESSWKAWLWGSSISRPYRALIRYGLFSTSSSWRRKSIKTNR